jgi:hypothetical protein
MKIKTQRIFKSNLIKGLAVLILGMVGEVSWGQPGSTGHFPSTIVGYTPTTATTYSISTITMLQGNSITNAGKPYISNADATDLFVNFNYDLTGKSVYLVYTTNGTSPTKSVGTQVTCTFGFYNSGNSNRIVYGRVPSQSAGTVVNYVFYISDNSLANGWGRVAGNGYLTSWSESDNSFFSYTTAYASSQTGNWSATGTWTGGVVPPTSSLVEIRNAHNVTLDQAATVATLTINSGGTFTASDNSARTLTISRTASATTLVNSGGTWANGSGGSTVNFVGIGSSADVLHTVSGTFNLNNVVINKTSGSFNVGVAFGSNGKLASGGKLTIGNAGYLSSIPSDFYTANGNTTLEFSTLGGYTVGGGDVTWPSSNSPASINITLGTVILNSARTASGNLNITGGGLTLGANLTINGNWTRASSATFTPSTFTVTLSGSSAQTIQITGGGTSTQYSLIVNNSAGVSLSNSNGNLTNLTVTNALTLTAGSLTTNGNTLTLNSGIAITRGTGTISAVPSFSGTSSITYTTGGVTTDNELNSSVTSLTCSNASGTVTLKSGATLTATTATNAVGGTFLVPITSTLILGSGGFSNSGPLTINGNLQLNAGSFITNAGNFTYGSSGNLIYNTGGSYGMSNEWPDSSGPNSITIQNSGTNLTIGASRTISSSGSMTVNAGCSFTVSSTFTLTTNNNLTLKSDATGTASIGNSAGSFSGEITVERHIPANGRRYRFLASPVVGGTTLEWRNDGVNTSGLGIQITGTGTVDASTSNAPSAFYYNESSTSNTGINGVGKWVAIDGSTTITNGRGYRVFVRGDRIISLTTVNSDNNATTISVKGTHPTTTVTLPVTYTVGDGGLGWNLVGNPYPCSIDFTSGAGWTKTNIGTGVAVYRPSSNSYAYSITNGDATNNVLVTTNGGSNIIGSGQAFWVRATATSPVLTCTQAVKVTSAPPTVLLKTAPKNQLRLKLTQDSSNIDETVIAFGGKFSDDFIETEDVNKLVNATVNISSVVGIEKYAAINFTSNNYKEKTIPLSVWGNTNGTYQLDLSQVEGFDPTVTLFLKDKFLNTTTAIDQNKTINFSITDDSLSKGDLRFELLFKNANTNVSEFSNSILNTNLSVYPNPATDVLNINISNANFKNSEVVVYNISGIEILKTNMANNNAQLNIESLSNGVYFLKVSNENGFSKTVKFVK